MDRDKYFKWLNDAYAMEQDIIKMLEGQLDDFADYPEVASKVREHIEVTKSQAERVKGVIEKNGGDVSGAKSLLGQAMGAMGSISAEMMPDKPVTYSKLDYATEHFEMAKYMGLMEAAHAAGDHESMEVFRQIHDEEKEMGEWLHENMPALIKKYIASLEK